eukprot:GEMP01021757.1.p1 GENE.GEMP01021757.1~~GEMP01021757.1.p1  ORF type:complete len:386 (+),score=81.27 GEMP01021757.1:42-1199(+)
MQTPPDQTGTHESPRTEDKPSCVGEYFSYYGKLVNQQNMMQDSVRTTTYRKAILDNPADFKGKRVMDVGAGSGILSFFAAQAGAAEVHAVEASSMADVARKFAEANNLTQVKVIHKTLETITDEELPKVDVLISEPIGTFLFNERMIESYIMARDRFLKPGGKLFPAEGNLCIAPFTDAQLHWDLLNKNQFWKNKDFYGIDLSSAFERASEETFRQPVVDYINPEFISIVTEPHVEVFDFHTCTVDDIKNFDINFDFEITKPCLIHGLAGWFDAIFPGSEQRVVLTTAPWAPGTHWYQIRFVVETPLAVNSGQHVEGRLEMRANTLQSYYVKIVMGIAGTNITTSSTLIDLKDPDYRFYSAPQTAYYPPGTPGFQQPAAQAQTKA